MSKTIWTDLRGNFSPYPTLTCNMSWDADKPWPPDEPLPANPPSSGVSDAPTPECKCDVEIRANGERLGAATVYVRMCPLHEHALDLYTALAVLLRATEDICSMEGIALLSIAEAEIAETALAKARGEKP